MDEVVAFYEKMKPYSSKVKGQFKLIHMAGVALEDPLLHTNVDSFNRKKTQNQKKNPLKIYLRTTYSWTMWRLFLGGSFFLFEL